MYVIANFFRGVACYNWHRDFHIFITHEYGKKISKNMILNNILYSVPYNTYLNALSTINVNEPGIVHCTFQWVTD